MNMTPIVLLFLSAHAAAASVTEPPMASIPAGTFAMGSSTTIAAPNYPVEQPVHEVRIAAFQMSKYEVTVAQFRQFVEATGHATQATCWQHASNEWGMESVSATWRANGYPQGEYHPVMCVTWADAKAYAAWLAASTGKPYRLPSEAEWEYAARAGNPGKYHFDGDEAQLCRYGNIRDTLGRDAIGKRTGKPGKEALCTDGAAFTTVVGMYEPNPFGLYDMIGNVGEIVEDCEHLNYDGAPADGSAWTSNCANDMKIHRGGNFGSRLGATLTGRAHTGKDNASSFEGFRVALGLPGPARANAAFEAALEKERIAERLRRKVR